MPRRHLIGIVLLLILSSFPSARAAKLGPEHVKALEGWLAMVDQHTPGRSDDALSRAASLTYDQRAELNGALPLFFSGLLGRSTAASNDSEARIVDLGTNVSRTPGATRFIVRAATLHGDAVIFGPGLPAPPSDPRDINPDEGQLVMSSDGEYQGLVRSGWQAKFARALLDRMPPDPSKSPIVAQWYHAQAAYLVATRRYGEATPDLRRAAELFPNDAWILFDRACVAEVTGLPRSAQVLMDPRAESTDGGRGMNGVSGRGGLAGRSGRGSQFSVDAANAEAERLFRRVLEVDASRADARVRLARLLIVRRRYAEADAELTRALSATPASDIAYLAHLFATRATARLGRFDDASAHVERALALFPDAQSALIARSQLALQRADVPGALAPIARLASTHVKSRPADPWMSYETGIGADQANALLARLWASVAQ